MGGFFEDVRADEDRRDAEDRAWERYCERVERRQEVRMNERDAVVPVSDDVAVIHADKAPGAETSPSARSSLRRRD